ncbi:MAG: single-stranded-DNA-specific exonuclease RecJ [Treponema sp.]|nr:single-stranded-DNA-specific exonuclease RecJ [Treponema sp.]
MKWEKRDVSADLVKNIAGKYDCDLLTASILARRGMTTGAEIKFFLEDDPRYLRNPYEIPGMEDAVERILAARDEGEKVLIFGDRDVDGICATTIVAEYLQSLEMDISIRLPTGDEPYGLSIEALTGFAADGGSLIITVDCGISNIAEVLKAGELGIDVIITDHHNPREELPEALVIVNPKLGSGFGELAGCGVAYKLVCALRFALKSELYGQQICLLNTRPVNDAWIIEIAKLKNLVVMDVLSEMIVPGMISIGETRLPAFLEGQQIFAWDAGLQKKSLAAVFGTGFEVYMQDIAGEIGKEIPAVAGKSLLRIKELSRLARYNDGETTELDVFILLFTSFIRQREKLSSNENMQELQLVSLGTIADIMPLLNENRIMVRQGLKSIMEKPRPGLSDLIFKLDLSGRRIGTTEISWILSPAINAAGRMGKPRIALDLFMEKDPLRREKLASELIELNEERKKVGDTVWNIIEPMAAQNMKSFSEKLAFAADSSIPRGVTGIMANRLMNRFKTPALVASMGENTITASLRSLKGYELGRLLEPCSHLLDDWGGHNFAAGLSVSPENWQKLHEHLMEAAAGIVFLDDETEGILSIDAELPLSYLTKEIYTILDRLEPYGEGYESLNFMACNIKVDDISLMGKPEAKHVKLSLDTGQYKWPAVYWDAAEKVKVEFDTGDHVDLVFKITRNWFKGTETPQLIVSDLRRTGK